LGGTQYTKNQNFVQMLALCCLGEELKQQKRREGRTYKEKTPRRRRQTTQKNKQFRNFPRVRWRIE
jgi:uncharacterized membrane protein